MRRLDPYMDSYDQNPLVSYLSPSGAFLDIPADTEKIKDILDLR